MDEQSEEDFCNSFLNLSQTSEYSKNRRFSRTSIIIAEGVAKKTFLGYDHDLGHDIAWTILKMSSVKEKAQVLEDFRVYSRLSHTNLLKIFEFWEDIENCQIITITEIINCDVKQHMQNVPQSQRSPVIKTYAKSMLEALFFLHSKNFLHKNIRADNIYVENNENIVKIGLCGLGFSAKKENFAEDFQCLAFCIYEIYAMIDLDYSRLNFHYLSKILHNIRNESLSNFLEKCFSEENTDKLLNHPFLRPEKSSVSFSQNSHFYNISIEEIPRSQKFYVLLTHNFDIIEKYEFNYLEDITEQFIETIISNHNLPSEYFDEILAKLEQHILLRNQCKNSEKTSEKLSANLTVQKPFPEPFHPEIFPKKKQKLSLNLGIQDLNGIKKVKVDLVYDFVEDTPFSIAKDIIKHFGLDPNEIQIMTKIISDKISTNESETFSNFSNQDLLDLTQEEMPHLRHGFNNTYEFSENSSLRNSIETGISDFANFRSVSPIEEEEKIMGKKSEFKELKHF